MKITPGSDEDSGEAAVEKTVAGENVKQQRQSLAVVLAEAIAAARASNAAGKAAAKAGETSKAAGMFRHGADILWEALTAAHTERRSGGGLEGESEVEDTLTETRRLFIDCLNNASAMLHKSGFFREAEAAATRVLQSPAVLGDAGAKNSKARFRRCRARLSRYAQEYHNTPLPPLPTPPPDSEAEPVDPEAENGDGSSLSPPKPSLPSHEVVGSEFELVVLAGRDFIDLWQSEPNNAQIKQLAKELAILGWRAELAIARPLPNDARRDERDGGEGNGEDGGNATAGVAAPGAAHEEGKDEHAATKAVEEYDIMFNPGDGESLGIMVGAVELDGGGAGLRVTDIFDDTSPARLGDLLLSANGTSMVVAGTRPPASHLPPASAALASAESSGADKPDLLQRLGDLVQYCKDSGQEVVLRLCRQVDHAQNAANKCGAETEGGAARPGDSSLDDKGPDSTGSAKGLDRVMKKVSTQVSSMVDSMPLHEQERFASMLGIKNGASGLQTMVAGMVDVIASAEENAVAGSQPSASSSSSSSLSSTSSSMEDAAVSTPASLDTGNDGLTDLERMLIRQDQETGGARSDLFGGASSGEQTYSSLSGDDSVTAMSNLIASASASQSSRVPSRPKAAATTTMTTAEEGQPKSSCVKILSSLSLPLPEKGEDEKGYSDMSRSDVLSSSNTVSEGADNTSLSERVYRENYMTPGWLEQQEDLTKGEEDSEHINDEKGTVAATTMAMTQRGRGPNNNAESVGVKSLIEQMRAEKQRKRETVDGGARGGGLAAKAFEVNLDEQEECLKQRFDSVVSQRTQLERRVTAARKRAPSKSKGRSDKANKGKSKSHNDSSGGFSLSSSSEWLDLKRIEDEKVAHFQQRLQRSKQLKTDQEKLQTQRQRPSTKKRSQKLSGLASLSERNGAEQSAWNELQNDEAVKIRIFKERTKHSD